MDKTFQKFLRYSIDLSPVGVERRADNPPLLLHAPGRIRLWLGGDGWHPFLLYSRIRRHGVCYQPHERRSGLRAPTRKGFCGLFTITACLWKCCYPFSGAERKNHASFSRVRSKL